MTLPRRFATARALPLVAALILAGCADGPAAPEPGAGDLDLLRSATLTGDSLLAGMAGSRGAMPMPGLPIGPIFVGPPIVIGPGATGGGCAYDAASGRTDCGPVTVNGLTFSSSFGFADAAGVAQPAYGPTTDRVSTRSALAGTTTFPLRGPSGPAGTLTLTVDRRAEQTTSGLADPRGRRRTDGSSEGTETSIVAGPRGTVRRDHAFVDTTANLVMELPARLPGLGTALFIAPLSGRVVRVARIVETPASGAPRTTDLRTVTEFLEGSVARTTITVNGVTRVCTQQLGSMQPPVCR